MYSSFGSTVVAKLLQSAPGSPSRTRSAVATCASPPKGASPTPSSTTPRRAPRESAERELEALSSRQVEVEALERARDALLASWSEAVPAELDNLNSEEKNELYHTLCLELTPREGGYEVTVPFCTSEPLSRTRTPLTISTVTSSATSSSSPRGTCRGSLTGSIHTRCGHGTRRAADHTGTRRRGSCRCGTVTGWSSTHTTRDY